MTSDLAARPTPAELPSTRVDPRGADSELLESGSQARPTGVPARQRVGRFDFAAHACFACGQLNIQGLRLDLHAQGDRCWTATTIPATFQGWEGITHGGVVAAILDEVMAWSLLEVDRLGFTARLEVDFKRPVPVGHPIRAEGWIVERRRRRFDTQATLTHATTGQLLAEARAIYLGAPLAQEAALRERYDIRTIDEATT